MTKTLIKIGALTVDAENYETPLERTFREAWTFGGNPEDGIISIDMDKARDIWRDKIRQARAEPLLALDAAFMKALETGADTSAIAARKQYLRDAPADPRINAATTPEELKAITFEDLTVV